MSERETKYSVPDGHWQGNDDDEADSGEEESPVEVTRHTVTVDDQRDAHGYEHGLDWTFFIEGGLVTGYYRGHWLKGKTQSDPMPSPAWTDVPQPVKDAVADELHVDGADRIPTDLPEHYGGGRDE